MVDASVPDGVLEKLHTMVNNGDIAQIKMTLRRFSKEVSSKLVNTLSVVHIPGSYDTAVQSTLLLMACRHGHFNIACLFVKDYGANIHLCGSVMFDNEVIEGSPPIWVAAAAGHKGIVEMLLNSGASVNATTKSNSTPLRAACYDGHLEIVELLVNHGADIEIANRHGHTSLMIACYRGHIKVVTYLLGKGALVNRSSHKGNTALHDCAEAGHVEIIKLLLQYKAEMKPDDNRVTPIIAAALSMHLDVVVLLSKDAAGNYTEEGCDAMELLGATMICKHSNLSAGIRHWRHALLMRNANNGLRKNVENVKPCPAYDNIQEFTSISDLDALSVEPSVVHITALLIYERVLGSHLDTFYYIRYRGAVLADGGDYMRCLMLWLRALDLQTSKLDPLCVLTQSMFFFSFTKLTCEI